MRNQIDSKKEESAIGFILTAIIVAVLIIGAWLGTYFYLIGNENKGVIGDMFGSINALFSGLALAGIILTILLQRKELKLQREELKLQRDEIIETREEFKIQNETLKLQRFENTLFHMISLHHQAIKSLNYEYYNSYAENSGKTIKEGSAVFGPAKVLLQSQFSSIIDVSRFENESNPLHHEINKKKSIDIIRGNYNYVHNENFKRCFDHYFLNLYHIFKFIFTSSLIDNSQKKFYTSIVRAQLSSDELFLILYNSLVEGYGNPNFLFLIRELDILQNFNFQVIENLYFHKEIFEEELSKAVPIWDLPKGYIIGSIKNA